MARPRYRETAMIEPEPYREERPPRGFVMPLIFGLVIGLGGVAIWLGLPGFVDYVRALYESVVVASLPEDYQQYGKWVALGAAIVLLLLVRGVLLRIPLLLGAILGALVWVAFGNHVMALVPQIEENLPELRAGIDGMLADYPILQNLRDVAESNVAVPGTAEGEN